MNSLSKRNAHQSVRSSVASRCQMLEPGRALTLQAQQTGWLRVRDGRVWVTLEGPHAGPANDRGDWFLSAGDELALLVGQRVVMESSGATANVPASYEWVPAAVGVGAVAELGQALGLVARAAKRLMTECFGVRQKSSASCQLRLLS